MNFWWSHASVFVIGSCFGSLSGVIFARRVRDQSWIKGRSRCSNCNSELHFTDLIPILSYLVRNGHCRYCGTAFGIFHLYFEIITALLFLLIYLKFGLSAQALGNLAIAVITMPLIYYDLKYFRIPSSWTNFCIAVQLFLWMTIIIQDNFSKDIKGSITAFLLSFVFYLTLYRITGGAGIGWGDVKLAPPLIGIAAMVDLTRGIVAFASGLMIPGLLAIVLLAFGKVNRKTQIPLGPFLVFGFWFAVFVPENLVEIFESIWLI